VAATSGATNPGPPMNQPKQTTVKTLTEQQIARLKTEAGEAGDHAMSVICDLALEGEIDGDDYTGVLSAQEAHDIAAMTRDEAYVAIVRAINDAEAQ
jgi:hypothetical protein